MKKVNPYAAAFVLGSSFALLLEVARVAVPHSTATILPLGGESFVQLAICILGPQAVAAIYDHFK